MKTYLLKVPNNQKNEEKKFFVGVLKVKDENSRIWIHWLEARIHNTASNCIIRVPVLG